MNKIEKARIKLWTSRDMVFRINSNITTIRQYTQCEKVPYTPRIIKYLERMESCGFNRPSKDVRAVCIMLEGSLRYVWRSDVLTEVEYNEHKKRRKDKIYRVFGQKFKGSVVQGDSER